MQIAFTPVRADTRLTLHRQGDILTINGLALDLSPLPEGAILPAAATDCPWITGDITRIDGALRLTLILPHGPTPPPETAWPAPITLTADGPVELPPHDGEPA